MSGPRAPVSTRDGLDPRHLAAAHAGLQLLAAGRFLDACAQLAPLVAFAPGESELRRAYADALSGAGDLPRAEAEARAALAADKKRPAAHLTLGSVLARAGRPREAEKAWRAALALDRRFAPAALRLHALLMAEGRAGEAAQAIAPLAALSSADAAVLAAAGESFKTLGRKAEALEAYRRAQAADPGSGLAEHNLAAALADLRRDAEALDAADRARAKGLRAPETDIVRAHALQGLGRYDEAEAAYREALALRPGLPEVVRDLAHLIWARTGEVEAARAPFDAALRTPGAAADVLAVDRARLLDHAGRPEEALRSLEPLATGAAPSPRALSAASHLALAHDPDRAAALAERALALAAADTGVRLTLAEARLAQGRPAEASALADEVLALAPADQHALAVATTAWRLTSDARLPALYDFDAVVGAYAIETPPGWADVPAYLSDLAAALTRLHDLQAHPIGQSLRDGTQTAGELRQSKEPAIAAFFRAIEAPIRAHMARLGRGRDALRGRNTGRHALAGAWSVRLRPGGRHVDHIHTEGWLSSAFYVDLPPAVAAGGREGWIKFGEPPWPVAGLGPEHWVRPEPGRLVLFPSYMWHGTAPFGGDTPRLTLAFDVIPA